MESAWSGEEWLLGAAVVNGAHVEERGIGGRRIWSRRRGDALAWVAVTGPGVAQWAGGRSVAIR